ncbi:STAS domain-containing protein [Streptomyces sp. NPDC003395]
MAGDLDPDTGNQLVDTVTRHLTHGRDMRCVRLDCALPTWIDSVGLSALLMVHRRADAGGCLMRLDNRPALLDHLLRQTGTLDLLTVLPDPDDDGAAGVPAT